MTQTKASLSGFTHILAITTSLVSVVFLSAPLWSPDPLILQATGIVLFCVGLWATSAIPIHITALIMFLVSVVLDIAPTNVVFAGFHAGSV